MVKPKKTQKSTGVIGSAKNRKWLNSRTIPLSIVVLTMGLFGIWKLADSFAAPPPVVHVHDSGRYDRPVRLLLADAAYQRSFASIITRTELVGAERFQSLATATRADNWTILRVGGSAPNESSVEWDNTVWKLASEPVTRELSAMTYKSEQGETVGPFLTTRVRLTRVSDPTKKLLVFTVHLPVRNTATRIKVWEANVVALGNIIEQSRQAYPASEVLVTGDWNMNWRNSDERARLIKFRDRLGFYTTWGEDRLPATGGTHGSEVIDMSFASRPFDAARLLPDTDASDHRAFRENIRGW